jgi:hypothetical protein
MSVPARPGDGYCRVNSIFSIEQRVENNYVIPGGKFHTITIPTDADPGRHSSSLSDLMPDLVLENSRFKDC